VERLGHRAIGAFHLRDLREQGGLAVGLLRLGLQLAGALLHRGLLLRPRIRRISSCAVDFFALMASSLADVVVREHIAPDAL
jgi:hypothetical protein